MGHNQTEMAQVLKVNHSTGGGGYRPKQADEKAMNRRCKAKPRIETGEWKLVEEKLCRDWSSEQVSGWLKKQGDHSIRHKWIYQHILVDRRSDGDHYQHLRRQIVKDVFRNTMRFF